MYLLILLVAIPVVVLWIVFARARRIRESRRIEALAPGSFVFLFDSNRWYQLGLQALRDHGVIEPRAMSEDISDGVKGPHWVAASSTGIAIHHGYSQQPGVTFEWSQIAAVSAETFRPNTRDAAPAVIVTLSLLDTDIKLAFLNVRTIAKSNTAAQQLVTSELGALKG